jgi:Mrp family chromosome partitioning ATPase
LSATVDNTIEWRTRERVAVVHSDDHPEFTDTVTFRSPVMDVDANWLQEQRILSPGATGPLGASYKMLRAQVLRRMEQLGANTLAVMSPTAGDGKTLTAINLAIAIAAESARTVLLVDFDLRNPGIHRRLGIKPELGVEEALQSHRPVQEAMIKIKGYERLTILPACHRIEHSSELLSGQTVAALVADLRSRYANRVLIFDLPPVLQADDALTFSKYVQAGLIVVNEGNTKREDVVQTLQLLQDTKIVGTVLNGSREKQQNYY